jgi:serine/threonine-protein kinase
MLTGGDEPGVPLVKILDFGLGKLDDRPTREGAFAGVSLKRHATLAGAPLGTPDYMSPEQVRGATDLDGRCDVWALAVVTYQLLTGVCPFEGDSIADTMFRVLSGKREPILTYRPDLPEATGTLFMRAFAPEIEDRFPSASSFASALQALVGDEAARPFAPTRGSSPPPGGVSRALPSTVGAMGVEGRGHRSHAGLFALTGIAFALLLGVLAPHARSTAPSLASGRDVRDVRGEVSALDVRSASAAVRPSSEAPSSTARAAASSAPFVLGSAPVAPVATLPVAASRATPRRVVPRPSMKAAAAVPSASGAATASPSPAPAATASSGPEHREDEAPYL